MYWAYYFQICRRKNVRTPHELLNKA